MRARLGLTMTGVVMLLGVFAVTQALAASSSATSSPTKKKASASADKATQKYFLEIYSLPPSCMSLGPDASDPSMIKTLTFHKAMWSPGIGFFCAARSSLVFSNNAVAITDAKALGGDAEYELDAAQPDKIIVYSKAAKLPPASHLTRLERAIDELAGTDFVYAEIIQVPLGKAKSVAGAVSALNAGGITATPIDGDQGSYILLKSAHDPDPVTVADLKRRIFDLRWQSPAAPPTQRLFHLDASAVVKDLAPADGDSKSDDKSSASKGSGDGTSVTNTVEPSVSVKVSPGATGTSDNTADSSEDDSSDTASASQAKKQVKVKATSAKDKQSADTAAKPLVMQAVNDTLVYSNSDGTDRGMYERNRLMAILDLPRPEVLLNLWALQASSRDYKVTNAEAEATHAIIAEHSQALQEAIDDGWDYLSKQMKQTPSPGFFNTEFYNYITQKFVLERDGDVTDTNKRPALEKHRAGWGWCNPNTYCLGFAHAFEPLRPTFTNILMAIIAAEDASRVAQATIEHMEGGCPPDDRMNKQVPCVPANRSLLSSEAEQYTNQVGDFRACLNTQIARIQTARAENGRDDCELTDRLILMNQLRSVSSENPQREHLQLYCFKRQAQVSFGQDPESETTRIGLLRAAIADFLFDYKWATQYPHDFVPYDLSQSAQELNAELNPLILAFNRDVAAFTESVQSEMECKYDSIKNRSWFGQGDETFLNDGMIGVRGISGVESIVNTVSESFFDATKPPSLTDLVSSVSDAEKNVPGVLKANLTANEAAVLIGALNSVKPAEAKIGRQLKLDVTPHALAGASSAELDVKITAEESGSPTFYTADKSTEDTLSRVGTHDTTTKIRVDSLKLFDVSSFSAMLQRPKSKFPVVPPFFEVPYFGSFISFPIPGAKVYHRSTAIISAVIVPTAADLAYGIDFTADRVCETAPHDYGVAFEGSAHYMCHRASSPSDFGGLPLRNYHKAIVQCLVSRQQTAHTGLLTLGQRTQSDQDIDGGQPSAACNHLSFSTVSPE